MIDAIDTTILSILHKNARTPNADIARQVGMAPSAVLERIRKLEDRGIIQGYTARIDPKALGLTTLAFILVRTKVGCWQGETGERLATLGEVEEVHHIAGEDCFLVKVRVKDTDDLGAMLRDRFSKIETIGSTRTTIVLDTVKESTGICPTGEAGSKRAVPTVDAPRKTSRRAS